MDEIVVRFMVVITLGALTVLGLWAGGRRR